MAGLEHITRILDSKIDKSEMSIFR